MVESHWQLGLWEVHGYGASTGQIAGFLWFFSSPLKLPLVGMNTRSNGLMQTIEEQVPLFLSSNRYCGREQTSFPSAGTQGYRCHSQRNWELKVFLSQQRLYPWSQSGTQSLTEKPLWPVSLPGTSLDEYANQEGPWLWSRSLIKMLQHNLARSTGSPRGHSSREVPSITCRTSSVSLKKFAYSQIGFSHTCHSRQPHPCLSVDIWLL